VLDVPGQQLVELHPVDLAEVEMDLFQMMVLQVITLPEAGVLQRFQSEVLLIWSLPVVVAKEEAPVLSEEEQVVVQQVQPVLLLLEEAPQVVLKQQEGLEVHHGQEHLPEDQMVV
jgi:hypothetical protein